MVKFNVPDISEKDLLIQLDTVWQSSDFICTCSDVSVSYTHLTLPTIA